LTNTLANRKQRVTVAAIGVATVAGAIVAYQLLRKPSVLDVAHRGLSCIESRDAGCVGSLASSEEITKYRLSRKQLEEVLREYVFPAYENLSKVGEREVNQSPEMGVAAVSQMFVSKDGTRLPMQCIARLDPDGVHLKDTLLNTVIAAMQVRHARKSDTSKAQLLLRGISADAPQLTRLGVKGLVRGEEFALWADLITDYKGRIAKMEAHQTEGRISLPR
jgi:hypothetical protein